MTVQERIKNAVKNGEVEYAPGVGNHVIVNGKTYIIMRDMHPDHTTFKKYYAREFVYYADEKNIIWL